MQIKIAKAIELLEQDLKLVGLYIDPDRRASIELGVEALKVVKASRPAPNGYSIDLLPGEQPEEIGR